MRETWDRHFPLHPRTHSGHDIIWYPLLYLYTKGFEMRCPGILPYPSVWENETCHLKVTLWLWTVKGVANLPGIKQVQCPPNCNWDTNVNWIILPVPIYKWLHCFQILASWRWFLFSLFVSITYPNTFSWTPIETQCIHHCFCASGNPLNSENHENPQLPHLTFYFHIFFTWLKMLCTLFTFLRSISPNWEKCNYYHIWCTHEPATSNSNMWPQ